MLSAWLEVTKGIQIATTNTLSIILLGGVLNGFGSGIIFRGDGSTGGSDIVAKIINKHFSISMATVTMVINAIIMIFSIFFFGLDLSILTLSTMFVASRVTHFVVDGLNYKRTLFIITTELHYQVMANDIMSELLRGVTIIPAKGAYTGSDKFILYTTISIQEVAKIKHIVAHHDPTAFVTITPTAQVIGNGRGFLPNTND
ncbi:MAG: YitT family protein, partial [Cellulosilyticaceae bacterium]